MNRSHQVVAGPKSGKKRQKSGKEEEPKPTPQEPETPEAVLTSEALNDILKQVDPCLVLDSPAEEMMQAMALKFVEDVVSASCKLAKHRKAKTLETRDCQLYLDRTYGITVPGFGTDNTRLQYQPVQKTAEHYARLKLIERQKKKDRIVNMVKKKGKNAGVDEQIGKK